VSQLFASPPPPFPLFPPPSPFFSLFFFFFFFFFFCFPHVFLLFSNFFPFCDNSVKIERGGQEISFDVTVGDLHAITPNSYVSLSGAVLNEFSYQVPFSFFLFFFFFSFFLFLFLSFPLFHGTYLLGVLRWQKAIVFLLVVCMWPRQGTCSIWRASEGTPSLPLLTRPRPPLWMV